MKFYRTIVFILAMIAFLPVADGQVVDGIRIYSESMDKQVPNIVITPSGYGKSQQEYPVVYLLHGAGGDFTQWMGMKPELKDYADQYELIIVCPDGGSTSWYFDSPVDPSMRYETYITTELVNYIDENYRTLDHSNGRAITGLSMGGHGALYLSIRHPEIWGAAGSTSGGVDIRPFPNGWDLPQRLGKYADHPNNWEDNTVINMVDDLARSDLALIFDCGVDDFFFDANQRLHEALLLKDIPHDYTVRPGKHDADYWIDAIPYHLLFFDEFFEDAGCDMDK